MRQWAARSPQHTLLKHGLFLFVVAAIICLSFFSQQRNADGPLQDIARVTEGQVDRNARHILYTLLGVPYYGLWRGLGYAQDAAQPLQVLNAVCGAFGVVGLFVFLFRLTGNRGLSLLLAAVYAFSYAYWYYVEDVFYNIVSLTPVIWSLVLLDDAQRISDLRRRAGKALVLALLGAVAVLGSQEHLLSVVVLACGLLLSKVAVSWKIRLSTLAVYLTGLASIVLLVYAALSYWLGGCRDLGCFTAWLQPYDTLWPMFGALAWDRVPWAGFSFLAAIVPLNRGMALRSLVKGTITPGKLLPQFSLLAILVSLFLTATLLIVHRRRLWREQRSTVLLSLVWICLYVPANVWLDPYNPERWIVVLIPVVVLAALAWNAMLVSKPKLRPVGALGLTSVALLVFMANLSQAIWPDHYEPNPDILAAQYAATQMTEADILISPRWDWTMYLESEGRRSLGLPWLSLQVAGRDPDPELLLAELDRRIAAAEAAGGRAFMVSAAGYTQSDWAWITENLGLRPEDLDGYEKVLAWDFDGEHVWQVSVASEESR
jgi:hypothetical protein